MTAATPTEAQTGPVTLYGFGPWLGLPDSSPFVLKTEIQLKMAGVAYVKDVTGHATAPKSKLPYLRDVDGTVVSDSTFIRAHIEHTRGIDLDAGLKPRQRAEAWAIERMLEDHLKWAITWFRWIPRENFETGPARFFDHAPVELQSDLRNMALATMSAAMHAHGIGRHNIEDVSALGIRSLEALAMLLGDSEFLFGNEISGTDAIAAAMLASLITPPLDSGLRRRAMQLDNLVEYTQRMMARFFPPVPRYIPPRKAPGRTNLEKLAQSMAPERVQSEPVQAQALPEKAMVAVG
ncbi:glutathione S-transferase family protein [uncultured Ferrovibrio sp.]|jgi:glutathione S-transferase|uniref:glutathione S-transferase family protein n=1 Tax=uncultured Ferrovibrio sp. TaxID=1576913 RepID=UPI00261096A5|nr:glutathione S-transferase family protein [uncultured Ferrovibrio sp.]